MSNGAPRLTAIDKQYRAEEDVRTLVRSAEITGDSNRFAAAKKESNKQQAALKTVAKNKTAAATKKPVKKAIKKAVKKTVKKSVRRKR